MSLEFITRRERITVTTYHHIFDRTDVPGAGFAFDCDADGNLPPMNPAALANFDKCYDGTYPVIDRGVRKSEHSFWQPASVRCDCGATIWLDDHMTNTCERCGLLCNGSGQRLAPVSQWSDEDRYDVFGPQDPSLDDHGAPDSDAFGYD